ncbi:NEW3 domain-containing protein [Streptomyces luteolus]|uniref:NEW3 domain-containing protein n=1 Tax=Streptomyces luteolus TaxID=3043615 RepID=A0ABT6ST00_9ACTN|nr:NEW3 domain-containing protein [Streptomyces sp. B-S-A12]MDI3418742.1 NEW3 domain-containing protein [Streptomyces sp. B-S-A12]
MHGGDGKAIRASADRRRLRPRRRDTSRIVVTGLVAALCLTLVSGPAGARTTSATGPGPAASAGEQREAARWDLAAGNAKDLSGNGHDGEAGSGVEFTGTGARFDGSDDGEISVGYDAGYQPESIEAGERWRLELDGVVPTAVGPDYRAIVSGRSDGRGWAVYMTTKGTLAFWMAKDTGGWAQVSSDVKAVEGRSYDIEAEWNGKSLSIAVSGAATGKGRALMQGSYQPMGDDQPLRFANGGDTGTEMFFAGTIRAASVSVGPPPPANDPPAEQVCVPRGNAKVAPIDRNLFTGTEPTDEKSRQLRDIAFNATRHSVATWYPERYGDDKGRYLDFGGDGEYELRAPAMAAMGSAVPLATGTFDAEKAGLSEREATNRVTKLVSSLAYRHRANTEGGWGDPGDHWQTPLWSFYAAFAGWLLWDELSPAEQTCVQNMVEYEADKAPAPAYYRDRSGTIISGGNTQAEEDSSWSTILGLAAAMMPDHKHWQDWQRRNVDLMIAAYARPTDTDSDQVLNGRKLSDLLDGSNIENNGTVVNHGFLHPIYMLAFSESVNAALTSSLAGTPTPEAAVHNIDVVYDALVDREFTTPTYREPGGTIYRPGSADIYYPEGNDWGTKFPLYFGQADVIADVLGQDNLAGTKAPTWEKLHNTEAAAMQERHPDGHTYADDEESNYALKEQRITHLAGMMYLTRWLDRRQAICMTSRPYTTAESDPVLGELEAPEAAASALSTRATALEESGDLTGKQADRIRAAAAELERRTDEVRSARTGGDDQRLSRAVEASLATVSTLDKWLTGQRESGALRAGVARELLAETASATTGLSTLHRCSVAPVSASLELPDNVAVAGKTLRASAVVHNTSEVPLHDVAVTLEAPAGWKVEPTREDGAKALAPGKKAVVEFTITVPEGETVSWGQAIEGRATYSTRGDGVVVLPIDAPLAPTARE